MTKYITKTVETEITTGAMRMGFLPRYPLFDKHGNISRGGDITCSTCHDLHQLNPPRKVLRDDPLQRGNIADSFLREGIVDKLCRDCHGIEAYFLYSYYHRSRANAFKVSDTTGVHRSKNECLACHKSTPVKGEKGNLKFDGGIKLCISCHDGHKASQAIHPVNLTLDASGLKLPLPNGQITCLTCHDLSKHQNPYGIHKVTNPFFVRLSSPVAVAGKTARKASFSSYRIKLCFNCHGQTAYEQFNPHQQQLNDKKQMNEQVCLLCHSSVRPNPNISKKNYRLLAPINTYCIGCHPEYTKQHPFNADHYGEKFSKITRNILQTSMRTQELNLPLHEGQMVCTTCHNPHQRGVPLNLFNKERPARRIRDRLVGYGSCSACHRGATAPVSGAPF